MNDFACSETLVNAGWVAQSLDRPPARSIDIDPNLVGVDGEMAASPAFISPERWADWWLCGRCGGDSQRYQALIERDGLLRDRVLEHARLREGDTLLDVGTGNGLVGFAALSEVGQRGRVIFSDTSAGLLEQCRSAAARMGVLDRCEFVQASADDLSDLPDGSVDGVTAARAVTWVPNKPQAFREFWRVLRPGGRLSICEPIFSFSPRWDAGGRFFGYDISAMGEIAGKALTLIRRLQPPEDHFSRSFDEGDLLAYAGQAGFTRISLELQASVNHRFVYPDWESFRYASIWSGDREAAIREALTPAEAERFLSFLRVKVETEPVAQRLAMAYLWAQKAEER